MRVCKFVEKHYNMHTFRAHKAKITPQKGLANTSNVIKRNCYIENLNRQSNVNHLNKDRTLAFQNNELGIIPSKIQLSQVCR